MVPKSLIGVREETVSGRRESRVAVPFDRCIGWAIMILFLENGADVDRGVGDNCDVDRGIYWAEDSIAARQ